MCFFLFLSLFLIKKKLYFLNYTYSIFFQFFCLCEMKMWSKTWKTSTFIAKLFLKQHFWSETFSKAKPLKQNFFWGKLPKRNAFFSETKRNLRSETFLCFRETEAKRSQTVSVSLILLRSETFLKAKLGHPTPNMGKYPKWSNQNNS